MTAFEDNKAWQTRVADAEKKQKEFCDQFHVQMARDYFEGKQRPEHIPANEWITLNMIYSHLLAQLPALYSLDPYFYVKLKRSFSINEDEVAQWQANGEIRQAYLNYLKGELDLKPKARMSIQDAHFSIGVVKVYYTAGIKENPNAGQAIENEEGTALIDEQGNPLKQPKTLPINERYVIDRIDPDDILFGENSGTLEDKWDWIAEKLTMTLEEAHKDKRFNTKAIQSIQMAEGAKKANKEKKPHEIIIEMKEIYDLKKNKFFIWSKDANQFVMKPRPVPAGIEKHPYAFLRFTLRHKSPYPIPPMSQGLDPQREYNEIRSRTSTHRKRFNRKYEVFMAGLLDEDQDLSDLENGEDGAIVKKQTSEQVVRPISDAPLDQQTYADISLLKNDMAELLGSPEASRGIASADSATEAGIIDKRLEIKEGDRLSIVVDWLAVIGRKLDMLVQEHIDRDEAVAITGPEGEMWKVVQKSNYEEIQGEFQYSVDIGSTQPRLPQVERAQWTAFWSQVIIPFPMILTQPLLMKKIAAMFGIEDESMLKEFQQLGEKAMQQPPSNPGSQAGIPQDNPVAAAGGMAGGFNGGTINQGGQ